MDINLFIDFDLTTLLALTILSFIAGFIDAIVGGGGLIQLPALLISFPQTPLTTIFGTNKIAALAGTSISAVQYSQKIKFNYKLLIIVSIFAGFSSYIGAKIVSFINVSILKPVILVVLIGIALFTFYKKDLGSVQTKNLNFEKQLFYGSIIGILVGFYDGFFGPGTGSFFVLGFVFFLGFEFVHASAYAKVINCMTNIFALFVFIKQGNFIIEIALLLSICNILGSLIGAKLALKKGNSFIRSIFLFIVTLMILRYGYDIYYLF